MAGTIGNQQGALPAFKTTGQATFFTYAANTTADGLRYRVSPQAWYHRQSLGVLAECVYSSQEVKKGASRGTIDDGAWQVALSYVLTGEKASYKGIDPKKPFDLQAGAWGALEFVARVSEIEVDSNAFPTFASTQASAKRARGWGEVSTGT